MNETQFLPTRQTNGQAVRTASERREDRDARGASRRLELE